MSRTNQLFLLFAVVIAALAATVAFQAPNETSVPQEQPSRMDERPASRPTAALADEPSGPRRSATEVEGPPVGHAAAPIELWHGTLTTFDMDGEPRPPADGRIHVVESPNHPILVHRGRWERYARRGTQLTIVSIEFGDVHAKARERQLVFDDTELHIEADLMYGCRLNVVDNTTGRHLEDVVLAIARSSRSAQSPIPPFSALDRPVITGGTSPLTVPETPGVHTYWASAPGYAWQPISFSGRGGARTVRLDPGGGVRVMLKGTPPIDGRIDVHIEDTSRRSLHARAAVGTGLVLEGLPVQSLRAVLIVRHPYGPNKRIASVPFDVVAGERTEVEIDFDQQPALPNYGTLEVLLTTPGSAALPIEVLRIERVGDGGAALDKHMLDSERFSEVLAGHSYIGKAHGLVPGTWRVDTWPFGAPTEIEIAPGEHKQIEQALPALTQLVVWPRDARTGSPIPADEVAWRKVGGPATWHMDRAIAGSDHWILNPTIGAIEISVTREGYATVMREIDCAPGTNDVAIELEEADYCEIEVSVALADAEFPVDHKFWTKAEFEGPGKAVAVELTGFSPGSRSTQVASATFKMDAPGRYAVRFPEVRGYTQDFHPTIDAEHGRRARVEVQMHAQR